MKKFYLMAENNESVIITAPAEIRILAVLAFSRKRIPVSSIDVRPIEIA
ncbi:MAG: hypothetical protein J6U54_16620 [Clostridiales bacterium]|nr:hypothetical protein [Clostridiales bacterium]